MKNTLFTLIVAVASSLPGLVSAQDAADVHLANGVKIGEVSSTSAIVWTRLTRHADLNAAGTPFSKDESFGQSYADLDAMEGAVPGAEGELRLVYWPEQDQAGKKTTPWQAVAADDNFARQFELTDLTPATPYAITAEGRASGSDQVSATVEGSFATAPEADASAAVRFTVVTGQDYPRRDDPVNGHQIYPRMQALDLDFFVHTGDIEYYDKAGPIADTVELARFKWNRLYALPFQREFHNHVASYFIKDDHDTLKNDCWPGQTYGDLTWEQGLALYREQVPIGDKTFRTERWGKDLQVWMVEGRDFRSPNNIPDGPDKTIWGAAQKQWFFDTVEKSDATFRILISPTPIVGPDRGNKNDNHANVGFQHEGDQLRAFIGKQKNMYVICGDRHWQYVSVDPVSGVKEFSCGPTTDRHASGFSESNRSSMHHYLKIKGGFLAVEVTREKGSPVIIFRHHGVDGSVYNEERIVPQ